MKGEIVKQIKLPNDQICLPTHTHTHIHILFLGIPAKPRYILKRLGFFCLLPIYIDQESR